MAYTVRHLVCDPNYLEHYGIKGQKWGVRRYQNPDGTLTEAGKKRYSSTREVSDSPESLINEMSKFKYKDYDRLMSHDDVAKSRRGSCHDQVMYEYEELKKMGKNPKATFVIEHDKNGNGGTTHSFVTYEEKGKIKWFENAWGDQRGIKEFNSFNELKRYIKQNYGGNSDKYPFISFYDFRPERHKPGETLQELLDIIFED